MGKKVRREAEIVREWTMEKVSIITNIGEQIMDLHCKLIKRYADYEPPTLFERFILGYKDYWYAIDVTPEKPIGHNSDKDYLDGFSDEGNDATYEFSLGLGLLSHSNKPDISQEGCEKRIRESLDDYNPKIKKEKINSFNKQKKWTNRMICDKSFDDDKGRFFMFTAIYPFHGSDLSGHTEIIALDFVNDDEDGIGFDLALLGVHFGIRSRTVQKFLQKLFVKNRPTRDRSVKWDDYYPLLLQWEKEYKWESFWYDDFRISLGISRGDGFYYSREKAYSSWGNKRFNPWRNKFWRLI